ncbi:protoporphyrinogen oxidase HemJ [Azospirillum sp. B4]|uniref:protoporphyrinogen oxidase HemJ n=1 Tax=Azospirillum sp. B4 TaxID=95605 RepID=UPI000346C0D6|nr:protoporphyrinogen oxidase HemJ [Azospirillum sp. B4]
MYLWIKAVHVIAVISWMAGLLYLPRLFVYHCDAPAGSPQSETFKVMERRLLRAIMNPAMILAWACGLAMITLDPGLLKGAGWLHAKLTLVVLMTGAHMAMARWRRDFAEDRNTRPARFYRIANEVPTLLMILIVILVITRPF